MANEFRIKHGLIVTGSSYFSESMFAPNLPEETSPTYYITWRSTDGRFEVSEVSPTTVATTVGCWDYNTGGDPASGEFTTDPLETIGSTTSTITINVTDNSSTNQNALLSNIGKGSLITLYVGSFATTFEVDTINVGYAGSPLAIYRYEFGVTYTTGDQYSISGTPEMCLEVSAASPANQDCVTYKADNQFNVGTSEGSFLLDNGSTQTVGNTINTDIASFILNSTDLNGKNTKNFFNSLNKGDFIVLTYKGLSAQLTYQGLGQSTTFLTVNVGVYTSFTSTTIPLGSSFDICKSPGI